MALLSRCLAPSLGRLQLSIFTMESRCAAVSGPDQPACPAPVGSIEVHIHSARLFDGSTTCMRAQAVCACMCVRVCACVCVRARMFVRVFLCGKDLSPVLFQNGKSPHRCVFIYKGTPGLGCVRCKREWRTAFLGGMRTHQPLRSPTRSSQEDSVCTPQLERHFVTERSWRFGSAA